MIKLAVSGCQGRMGLRIVHLSQEDKDFEIVSLLEQANHPAVSGQVNKIKITPDPNSIKGADVLIEFTSPEATLQHIEACVKYRVKMVIGTTGLSDAQIDLIKKASNKIPIVFSSNMSVGVNILFKLAKEVALKTSGAYTARIIEAHHQHKKDKPSGTAKSIAKIIENSSARKISDIQSIREGEIIGDHQVIFESSVDTLTVSHHAKTRDIFAKGALVAAKFVATKKKGLFDMQDVLGLK